MLLIYLKINSTTRNCFKVFIMWILSSLKWYQKIIVHGWNTIVGWLLTRAKSKLIECSNHNFFFYLIHSPLILRNTTCWEILTKYLSASIYIRDELNIIFYSILSFSFWERASTSWQTDKVTESQTHRQTFS